MDGNNAKQIDHADVCLISPPFLFSLGPSLALGLLKAALLREKISCHVDYADMYMIQALGVSITQLLNSGSMLDYLGEYIFAELAGIEPEYGEEQILEQYRASGRMLDMLAFHNALSYARRVVAEQTDATIQRVMQYKPKIVGITSCFQQRNAALAIFRRLKELYPDIITVMGGANCFGRAGIAVLREFPFVDYVFFGESDDIFASVCKNAMDGGKEPLPYGVLKNGEPLPEKAPHRIITDLDSLPYPDFDEFFELLSTDVGRYTRSLCDRYHDKRYEITLYLETSRGCWWGEKKPCTFCGLHGEIRQFRQKSAKRAFDELCVLTEKYGIYNVSYTDCIMPRNWIAEFVPLLKAYPKKFRLFQELRSSISAEQIRELAEAGFTSLQPGIESLSDHELHLMHKGVTMMQNLNFLKFGTCNDVMLSWNILFGFPGETTEDYWQQTKLIPMLHHFQPPNSSAWMIYARNNEYVDHSEKYGIALRPSMIYRYTSPQKKEYIDDIALYYDGTMRVQPDINEAATALSEAVRHWRECYRKAKGNIRLDVADLGNRLLIIDTRECRDLRAQYLIGAERDVYRLCSVPVLRKSVEEKLAGVVNSTDLDEAIRSLTVKKLLISHSDKLFALAVPYDYETVKQRDIVEFRRLYKRSSELKERIDSAMRKCGGSFADMKMVVTQYAGKLGMCFTGDDYEKYAMPFPEDEQ